MSAYNVNPLTYGRALSLALCDLPPVTDAVFIHGSPAASDEIDRQLLWEGIRMVVGSRTRIVVINGLTKEECSPNGQRLAYPGYEVWKGVLDGEMFKTYTMIPPSKHTAAESDNLIKLAKEMGWESLTIMSYPHHILRCMLQMVFCLERAKSDLKVYTRTIPVNWNLVAEKGVLNSAPFSGTLIGAHMHEEYERLVRYADRDCFETPKGKMVPALEAGPNDKQKYTPHATLEELIAYYCRRDQVK